jgi:hypothetical protein
MIANPVLRKFVEFEYAAVRTPLALLDRRVPEESAVHRVLDRGLAGLDSLVAGLLAEPAVTPAVDDDELASEREQIAEAIRAEQAEVGELADPELDVADVQAKLRAKHIVEERLEQQQPHD